MNFTWTHLTIGLLSLILLGVSVAVWNKIDFCQDKVRFHLEYAERLREVATDNETAQAEAAECAVQADFRDIIAAKYARVSRQPWQPYPTAPLITPTEEQMVRARYEVAEVD